MNFFSKWFSLYTTLPWKDQCQAPIIRCVPKTLHQTLVNFTVSSLGYWQIGYLWWEAVESWFHLDLKSFFALKKNNGSLGFLLSHITRWINVIYESRMKWTWHHSQIRFPWGKFPPQTQKWYSFIYYLYTMEQMAWWTWMSFSYGFDNVLRDKINNYILSKMWVGFIYPFPNFNGATVEVWEWISSFIAHFIGFMIAYLCWD